MKLSGSHLIEAPIDIIWNMLLDPDVLARITPAVSRLERTGKDRFKAVADVSIGPVRGSFSGDLEVTEKNKPESFILKVKQSSRIGNVAADVKLMLTPVDDQKTEVSFDGDAKLSGLLARTGQRVIGSVANSLSRQFFESLQKEVEKQQGS